MVVQIRGNHEASDKWSAIVVGCIRGGSDSRFGEWSEGAAQSAEQVPPVAPVVSVTPGSNNVQTFSVTVPTDLWTLGATSDVEATFEVTLGATTVGQVVSEPVAIGELATASIQLERAGDYEVSGVLDDGTIKAATAPTTFTVDENLATDEPEISPEDDIANFLPAPVGFDLEDSLGADVDVPLLDGYTLGNTVNDGEAVEVLDPNGDYVGLIYSVAVLEDGTQAPIVYELEQAPTSSRNAASGTVVRASLRCGLLLGDPCEELFDDLFDLGDTAAAIVSTWVIDGMVVSGQLAGGAKRAVDGFKRALLDRPIHLPLDFGLLPDALSMADAPRFREGVGPADQVLTPSDYNYNPAHPEFRFHDYCSYVESWSYDTQFFGPCARHDYCIENFVQGKTGNSALEARFKCDGDFGDDLNRNCYVQNPPLDRSRSLLYAWCASTANAMWAAVTAKGSISP